jgi:hypothetical protein
MMIFFVVGLALDDAVAVPGNVRLPLLESTRSNLQTVPRSTRFVDFE